MRSPRCSESLNGPSVPCSSKSGACSPTCGVFAMLSTLPKGGDLRAPQPRRTARSRGSLERWAIASEAMAQSLAGQLLLASPSLLDPNFVRTVVLVGVHSEEGAMGVVLNRPSTVTVGEALPQLNEAVGAFETVFVGGPV